MGREGVYKMKHRTPEAWQAELKENVRNDRLPVTSSSVRTVGGINVTRIHDTIHINCHIDGHIQMVWLVVVHNNSIALALQIIECYHYRL